jgi:hypothetical protein
LRVEQFRQTLVEFQFRSCARFEFIDTLNARRKTKLVHIDAERRLPLLENNNNNNNVNSRRRVKSLTFGGMILQMPARDAIGRIFSMYSSGSANSSHVG